MPAKNVCGRCRRKGYCSTAHQSLSWEKALHREHCIGGKEKAAEDETETIEERLERRLFCWKEYELDVREPDEIEAEQEQPEEKGTLVPAPSFVEGEGYEKSKVDVDDAFLKFHKRMLRHPGHVLRYYRTAEAEADAAQICWPSAERNVPDVQCSSCGERMHIEFQASAVG